MKNRLKEARKARKLTLKQVADAVHVSESAISKFEHGATPSEQTIVLFCEKLRISRHWLETGEGEMFLPKAEDDQALVSQLVEAYNGSTVLRALLTTYMQLDAPRRAIFEDFIERFSAALAEAKAAGTPPPDASAYIRERTAPAPDQQAQ